MRLIFKPWRALAHIGEKFLKSRHLLHTGNARRRSHLTGHYEGLQLYRIITKPRAVIASFVIAISCLGPVFVCDYQIVMASLSLGLAASSTAGPCRFGPLRFFRIAQCQEALWRRIS